MKKIILLATLFLTSNALADYKIFIQSAKLDLPVSDSVSEPDAPEEPSEYIPEYIPEPDPWEPPSGVPAMHPNGVTVACLNMPNGEEFELNGKTYRVVYSKEDAATYASTACTSNIINMSYLFKDNIYFNTDISHWDTSNVTNMSLMFYNAQYFNQDISQWNTSKVIDMQQMFRATNNFNSDIDDWDTSSVLNMNLMFYDADGFNQNLNSWCVDRFSTEPSGFNSAASHFSSDKEPLWGLCPQEANKVQGYSLGSNGVTVKCEGMPNGETIKIYDELYRVTNTASEAVHYTKLGKKVCTSNLTDMMGLFEDNPNASPPKHNKSFNKDISHWDTSNVTNMSRMFKGALDFNSNISHWDTSNVTNMSLMFYDALDFNQDLSGWDTSKVIDMQQMFRATNNFNSDIDDWDTSSVLNMNLMFYDADGFNQNLNSWCVDRFSTEPSGFNSAASHFSSDKEPLWGLCPQEANKVQGYSLADNGITVKCDGMPNGETIEINNQLYRVTNTASEAVHYTKLGKKVCTSNLTDMMGLFEDDPNFNEDISHWDTSNVTNMSRMFKGALDFNSNISHWDTSNVTNMSLMFYDALDFNQDLSGWKTSKVIDMQQMFRATNNFNSDIDGWDTSNVLNMNLMFYDADGFNQNLNSWCVDRFSTEPSGFNSAASHFSSDKEPLWGLCPQEANKVQGYSLANNGVTVKCEGMPNGETIEINGKLYRVTNTASEAVHYTKLGKKVCTSNITNMKEMFKHVPNSSPLIGSPSFNKDISHWDTSNVTDMSSMFRNVTYFNSNISHWNTSNVTNMSLMFYNAQYFNQDISQWNTSKVIDMQQMFRGTKSFNSNISGWDTSNVLNMNLMFYDADGFNQNLNNWCVSQFSTEPSGFNSAASYFSANEEPLWGAPCN